MTQRTRDYLTATFERGRQPMSPPGFEIDWEDQPSRFKVYRDAERVQLPSRRDLVPASFAAVLERLAAPPANGSLDLDGLAAVLEYSNGVLGRRMAVHWNGDDLTRVQLGHPTYARGAPSGGGMYPTEIYFACGGGGPVRPGLYHVDNARHALARLSRRDPTAEIRSALAGRAGGARHFLLLSLFFWKNAFKYNNFSYHVVTQDLGAMFATMRVAALALGSDLELIQWYDDRRLDRLLGLDTREESVFAVIPLPLSSGVAGTSGEGTPKLADESTVQDASGPLHRAYHQQSRRVVRFPDVEAVHLEALSSGLDRPAVEDLRRVQPDVTWCAGDRVELPEPPAEAGERDVFDVIRHRQSSFGRHSRLPLLAGGQLAAMLRAGSALRAYRSDIKDGSGAPPLTRLMLVALNVDGLARGVYSYDHDDRCLATVEERDLSYFLQSSYFLQNYNLQECSAVLAIVGAPDPLIDVAGARGYRALNLEVGMVAQGVYLAASALDVSCGAVLGLDNVRLNQALRLEGSDQRTLLFLLVGPSGRPDANYDFSLL